MGSVNSTGSKLEKVLASDLPEHERYFGLENFGNTCYCNSVLQALYFCEPFRQSILQYTYNRKFLNQQLLLSSSSSSSKSTSTSTSTSTSISSTSINNHLFHFDSSLILQPITCSLSSPPASPSPSTSISPSAVITAPTTTPTTNHSTNNNIINNENNHISANHLTNTTTFRNNFDPSIIAPPDIERPLSDDDTMLTALADLFSNIAAQKKRSGSVPPKSFVTKLRQENELFSSYMHQDAHEFLNFILNNIVECLHKEEATFRRKYQQSKNLNQYHHRQKKQQQQHQQQQQPNDHNDEHEHEHEPYINNNPHSQYNNNNNNSNSLNPNTATPTTTTTSHVNANNVHNSSSNGQPSSQQKQQQNGLIDQQNNKTTTFTPQLAQDHMYTNTTTHDNINNNENNENSPSKEKGTFVHELFEGQLSNEVRCLCCETVTQRLESFFDLSVDVEQNSSLTACLKSFSSTELLQKQDKFFCDACCSLQEAERRMRIRKLPRILALHLKRFKYVEQLGKFKKLSYRVVFPLELRLCNTSDDAEDPDRLYSLFAVIVHVGSGPNQGHYVSLIKSHGQWLLFDDDCVEPKDESEIQSVYGITQDSVQSTEAGYILFYEQTSSS